MCKNLPDCSNLWMMTSQAPGSGSTAFGNGTMNCTYSLSSDSSTNTVSPFNPAVMAMWLSNYSNEYNGPNKINLHDKPYALN